MDSHLPCKIAKARPMAMSSTFACAIITGMKLSELKKSQAPVKLRIQGFAGDDLVIERLHEIGLHRGCDLVYIGNAPLGGPMLIEFGATVIGLRDEESVCLLIQQL